MLSLFDAVEGDSVPSTAVGQYNPELARKRRDEAIEHAEYGSMAHIGDDWPIRAYRAVKTVAERMPRFIVDEVWKELGEEPAEPRAIGAVMKRAVAENLITATESYEPSARVTAHQNPRRVWRSLVYKAGTTGT